MELSVLLKTITEVAKKYKGIQRLRLFGSYYKGLQTPESDVDLVIKMEDPYDADTFFDFLLELEGKLGMHVDLLDEEGIEDAGHLLYVLEPEGSLLIYGN